MRLLARLPSERVGRQALLGVRISDERIDATLKVDRTFDRVGESADPISVSGIVEERELLERGFSELAGEPVLHRDTPSSFETPPPFFGVAIAPPICSPMPPCEAL